MGQARFQPVLELDTKIGGEAGMAGVGRRGFHAAARAAMFTVPPVNLVGRPSPGFLDIQRAVGTSSSDILPIFRESNSLKERTLPPYLPRVTRRTLRFQPTLLSTSIWNWSAH